MLLFKRTSRWIQTKSSKTGTPEATALECSGIHQEESGQTSFTEQMNWWSLQKERSRWRLKARLCDPGQEKRSLYQQMQFTRSGMLVRLTMFGTMDIDLHDEQFVEKMVALGIKLNLNKT